MSEYWDNQPESRVRDALHILFQERHLNEQALAEALQFPILDPELTEGDKPYFLFGDLELTDLVRMAVARIKELEDHVEDLAADLRAEQWRVTDW